MTHFEIYKDAAGERRWRLIAGNNRTIADSAEGYTNIEDCQHGISILKKSVYAEVKIIPTWTILQDFGETVLVDWHDVNDDEGRNVFEVKKKDLDPLDLKAIEEYASKPQAWVKGPSGWVNEQPENNGANNGLGTNPPA